MAIALILGVNGQDGSYLAESLLRRGHSVVGIGRDAESRYVSPQPNFRYRRLDLADAEALGREVTEVAPDLAFHVAAVHGAISAGFTYEVDWRLMMRVNVFALHVLLEHARMHAPNLRIIYAGSSKVFPAPLSGRICEETPTRATCLYGIGKLAARELLSEYRRNHGVRGTNLILFNHDSPRRPRQFFLPTIAATIQAARRDPKHRTRVRTLDFRVDWSAADEIMDQVVDLALMSDTPEVVVASGHTVHARELITELFTKHSLSLSAHVAEDLPPRDPGPEFSVDVGCFVKASGRRPRKTAVEIVDDLLVG